MSAENPLESLGKVSDLGKTLVEKISGAIGLVYKPKSIRNVAKAEADSMLILAEADVKVAELKMRALNRMMENEAKKQLNIESITRKALPDLSENANPSNMEDDWIANFFEKCHNVSDAEMQSLWARVLAGEANSPGAYSKRTVNLIADLDKKDASLFTKLCSFSWAVPTKCLLVFDPTHKIYKTNGISFTDLKHLDAIGLISVEVVNGYLQSEIKSKQFPVNYFGEVYLITFKNETDNSLPLGKVLLTEAGEQLIKICGAVKNKEFEEYAVSEWRKSVESIVKLN